MPEPDNDPLRDLLRKALAKAVTGLAGTGRLSIVEVAADGVTSFKIFRDEHAVPRGRQWRTPWTDLAEENGPPHELREALFRVADVESGDALLLCSSPGSPLADQAFDWLRTARPDAPALQVDGPVAANVTAALRADPLTRSYDLVVLRPHPDDHLELATVQLFPVGTRPGAGTRMTLRCEPGGANGTAFAVVTWQGHEPRLLSVESAPLPAGIYNISAELIRPGRVRFGGVPALAKDPRGWEELIADVPARLPARAAGPAHLICAIEVSGQGMKVAERVGRARQVVSSLSARPELSISVLAYGAHSFDRSAKDHPVEVRVHRADVAGAQDALDALEARGAITQGYPFHPHAAQLEDMLVAVDRLLAEDRPHTAPLNTAPLNTMPLTTALSPSGMPTALLTIGDRPPHPPRADSSRILPCPYRHDWRAMLTRLEQGRGLVFGAIVDHPPGDKVPPVWRQLGSAALANLDALDIQELTTGLGLTADAVSVPFPLIDVK